MDSKRVLCKYHMNGVCREGSRCSFSHDSKDKPSMVCKYYLQGSCTYGSSCRYDHVKTNARSPKYPSAPKPVGVGGIAVDCRSCEPDNKMVKLTKKKSKRFSEFKHPANWAEAPEFIPGQTYKGLSSGTHGLMLHNKDDLSTEPLSEGLAPLHSYSQAVQYGLPVEVVDELDDEEASYMLCPFAAMGHCRFERYFVASCGYLHGLECEMCGRKCLNPYDTEQQEEHKKECIQEHEKNMEYSFALQRSEGVSCGICLEVVLAREDPSERRFGILSDCTHSFCLSCIRKWRNSSHTEKKIVRACPICRVSSGFVTPSEVWVEDQDEKERMINTYKEALWQFNVHVDVGVNINVNASNYVFMSRPCKYFAEGKGTCPFGTSCFYKHAYPDGRIEESQLRRYQTAEGQTKVVKSCKLWDFVQAREYHSTDVFTDDDPDNLL